MEDSESEIVVETQINTFRKRGFRHPEKYKVNRIKKARICGDEYLNYSGNTVEARKTGLPCS